MRCRYLAGKDELIDEQLWKSRRRARGTSRHCHPITMHYVTTSSVPQPRVLITHDTYIWVDVYTRAVLSHQDDTKKRYWQERWMIQCSPESHEKAVLVVEVDNPVAGLFVRDSACPCSGVHLEPVGEDVEDDESKSDIEEFWIHGAHKGQEARRGEAIGDLRWRGKGEESGAIGDLG